MSFLSSLELVQDPLNQKTVCDSETLSNTFSHGKGSPAALIRHVTDHQKRLVEHKRALRELQ
jgi:hypothetical protein